MKRGRHRRSFVNRGAPTPAGPPAAPVATAASNHGLEGFTANWNASAGATSYRLDLAYEEAFTNTVYEDFDCGAYTNFAAELLASGSYFYYRVRAVNGEGTSPNSNVITAATVPQETNASAATDRLPSGFTANWNLAGGESYVLDVALDAGFTTFAPGYENFDVGDNSSAVVTGLDASTDYYYRVRVVFSGLQSANSNVISVATTGPETGPAGVNSGIRFWFRPGVGVKNDLDENAINAESVAKWEDQSGRGNDVTVTGLAEPTYFTSPSRLTFDGVDDYLQSPNVDGQAVGTVFVVAQLATDADGQYIFDGSGRNVLYTYSGNLHFYSGVDVDGLTATPTDKKLFTIVFTGAATSSLRINGVEVAVGDAGSSAFNSLTFGVAFGDPTVFAGMNLHEFARYNRVLAPEEIDDVEAQLMSDHGLT